MATALIADDETLMLARMRSGLTAAWRAHAPDVASPDSRMPGKLGLEVAAEIGDRAHVIFVTAYNELAIAAFGNGAADDLLKPVEIPRLQETVQRLQRLQRRMGQLPPSAPKDRTAMVKSMPEQTKPGQHLKWIRVSVGNVTG